MSKNRKNATVGRPISDWDAVLEEVRNVLCSLRDQDVFDPFFRGQSDASWPLIPTICRSNTKSVKEMENRLFFDFASLGSHHMPVDHNTWDILYFMQHHGVPTRLLDWTESFSVALYFAVKNSEGDHPASVWILNPYSMNKSLAGRELVDYLNLTFPAGYQNYFADEEMPEYGTFPAKALAVAGKPRNPRMVAQRGVFTLHRDLDCGLEMMVPNALKRIDIPPTAIEGAKEFLLLSNVNEYSLFPDLDGLSRYLRNLEAARRVQALNRR